MNNNPEKDPVLNSVEQMAQHRGFIIDRSLELIIRAVPDVENTQRIEATPVEKTVERYPQNVVRLDLDKSQRQETEQAERVDYSRDVIDALFEEKNAA